MRICLICQEYPPGSAGGIGTYTANLAKGLARAGHRVSVIARAQDGREAADVDGSLRVFRIRQPQVRRHGSRVPGPGGANSFIDVGLRTLSAGLKVRELLRTEGVDVVQSPEHGAEGLMVSMLGRGVPHVVRFHTPLFMVNEAIGRGLSLGGRIVHALERTSARRATVNTCASRALADILAARFGIPAARVRIVPNAIDHEVFAPAPRRAPRPPTVLYVGKIAPLKGVPTLAQAIPHIIRQIPDARIVLVGSDHPGIRTGSSRAEMLEDLREAGVASSVTFVAPVERTRLIHYYQDADVCVLPTLWDNFPNTCLEAMACGVPVVASMVGGLPEIIDGGRNGILVPPNDPGRLAREVVGLLASPARRSELGTAARDKILSAYTMQHIVDATVAVYEEALALSASRDLAHQARGSSLDG